MWDTASWKPRHRYEWPEPRSGRNWATSAAFSPGSALLAAGNEGGELRVLDVAGGKILTTIQAHDAEVRTIAFSANGRWILTACRETAAPGCGTPRAVRASAVGRRGLSRTPSGSNARSRSNAISTDFTMVPEW